MNKIFSHFHFISVDASKNTLKMTTFNTGFIINSEQGSVLLSFN